MKKIIALIMAIVILSGCSAKTESSTDSQSQDSAATTITYSIEPNKEKYTAGEEFVISATISGDTYYNNNKVEVSWNYSICCDVSISSFPKKDGTTFTYNAISQSGKTITITAKPSVTGTINGVSQVVGTANFVITTE